jgi:hypothetical protein
MFSRGTNGDHFDPRLYFFPDRKPLEPDFMELQANRNFCELALACQFRSGVASAPWLTEG